MVRVIASDVPSAGGQADVRRMRLDFRTWFGLRGRASVGADDRHCVWAVGVPLPHYGLVNYFLRHRLAGDERLRVMALHERGHFETLPVAVALGVIMVLLGRGRLGRRSRGNTVRTVADWMAHHAVWEGLAEAWLLAYEGRRYQRASWWRAAGFWGVMLGAGAWLVGRGRLRGDR